LRFAFDLEFARVVLTDLPPDSFGLSDGPPEGVPLLPNNSFAASAIFLADSSASSAACLARASLFNFFASFSFIPLLLIGSSSIAAESTLMAPAGSCCVPDPSSTSAAGIENSKVLPSFSAFFLASLKSSGPRPRALSSLATIVSLGVQVAFFFIRFRSFANSYSVS
jgi:hypothetical protein